MNMKMTRFAFAGKCGIFGASGSTASAISDDRPINPNPHAARRSKNRLEGVVIMARK
jgi:hypothetical protein